MGYLATNPVRKYGNPDRLPDIMSACILDLDVDQIKVKIAVRDFDFLSFLDL